MDGILVANLYLLLVALGLCVLYAASLWFIPRFFELQQHARVNFSLRSIALILAIYTVAIYVVLDQHDVEWGNRLLHTFGGGFSAYIAYILAVRDGGVALARWRIVVLGIFIVTSLGVLNELVEFVIDFFIEYEFIRNVWDTWFDLSANTIGLIIAVILSFPFLHIERESTPGEVV